MELKVEKIAIPEHIAFNFDELKQELAQNVEKYTNLVYTDDQIKEAKADKAKLNKLKKALNDERIRREKEYMAPFNEFKAQIGEIIAIIDEPIQIIDQQLKEAEEARKTAKIEEIKSIFADMEEKPEWLYLEQIMDLKWLNASTSIASIKSAIEQRLQDIAADVQTLQGLPEYGFEALEIYKECLGINKAIAEAQRIAEIAKAKNEAQEEKKAENEAQEKPQPAPDNFMNPPEEPEDEHAPRQWVSFSAFLTIKEAQELKNWFLDRNINIKPAKEI